MNSDMPGFTPGRSSSAHKTASLAIRPTILAKKSKRIGHPWRPMMRSTPGVMWAINSIALAVNSSLPSPLSGVADSPEPATSCTRSANFLPTWKVSPQHFPLQQVSKPFGDLKPVYHYAQLARVFKVKGRWSDSLKETIFSPLFNFLGYAAQGIRAIPGEGKDDIIFERDGK
jgi:hypothetical protein